MRLKITNRAFVAHSTAMLLAGVLVVSNAAAAEQFRAETVKYQDLNVATPAGVEALYRRIHFAARRVCSPGIGWRSLVQLRAPRMPKPGLSRR